MFRLPTILALRAVRIGLIVVALGFIAYTAFGFWMVPRLVRSNLLDIANERYHRQAQVGEIRFNPFTLKLEIRDFTFPDADGAQLLAFERLMLNFDVSSVWKLGASFSEVELDQPFARVMLRPDGTLNLADLAKPANVEPSTEPAETPGVYIDRLSVTAGRVAFEDRARARPFATELRPITFELRDFSTGGKSGNAYSLHGASVTGERFAWSGNFALTPFTSSGKFEVAALKAATISSYLDEALAFQFTKGTLDLNGEYFYTAGNDGGLRFDVHRVAIADFGMRPKGKEQDYIEIAALALEESQIRIRQRRVDIGRVRLDGGTLRLARDAAGNINLAEFAGNKAPAEPPPTAAATPPAPAGSAPDWVVSAPDIAMSGMRVDVQDALVNPAANFSFSPVVVNVSGYSTAPQTRFKFDATARGDMAGELSMRGETDATAEAITGRLTLKDIKLVALQPYIATYTQITLNSGLLDSALDVEQSADAMKVKGEATVSKLATIDNILKQDLLKWERVALTGIDYSSTPARLTIGRIDARAPYARLVIAPDQTLNITKLFTPAGGATPQPVQTVRVDETRQAPGGNPGEMRISIGAIKVTQGSANFADFWIKPNYAVSVQELAGSVVGLSSDPASRAKVDLNGKVDRYAPAQIRGTMNLLSAALYTDMHVKFDGVEMTSVTPYSGHFAGYEIEKGKLSIDVNYLVENRQLTAKQKFVIDQLQLGDKVDSPEAVHLPLKLAVALLKDRNGVIDIDLPLTGSLDDPKFRVGPLIWKAFVGLLTKIATAPFALLARLGGSDEQINQLDFAAGSATLDAAAQERMAALAKALNERPALELEVPTAYSPDADGNALSQARLDARLAAAGAKPDMAEPDRFELLRKLYEKESSKAPLPAAALTVLEMKKKKGEEVPWKAGIEQLEAALRDQQPATDAELGDLARARTQAIRDSLLASGQIDPKRVYVLGLKPVAAVEGKVRVELALK